PRRTNCPARKRKPASRVVRRVNRLGVRVCTSSRVWRVNFSSLTVMPGSWTNEGSSVAQKPRDKNRQIAGTSQMVPTLQRGNPAPDAQRPCTRQPRQHRADAERHRQGSHAERGNPQPVLQPSQIVPTLQRGNPAPDAQRPCARPPRHPRADAERHHQGSHTERGNHQPALQPSQTQPRTLSVRVPGSRASIELTRSIIARVPTQSVGTIK